ncbi:metal ABC transporter solute-binding protein, Zn/Mn family [Ornithinimicrobium pratense]|uniref:Zinc ABC transporter substrate-binding protein n=1 Tax=Ornithinimicrobium pratense TaxID=2593973 RepID=A0A5J6V6X0_9MICO|nr:zinc ABC transporter substrate-binding protein [Ornithinimicrobium pratense]QFG68876.1 zinc ABC transporter substrate-binding protein [Ornithinimicrobium pratense]
MTRPPTAPVALAALTALSLTLGLAGCGNGDDGGNGTDTHGGDNSGASAGAGQEGQLSVVTSFYPIEYLASRVAGEHAEISTLTSAGVDPHDVELTPRQVATLGSADLVLYSAGMQPAVDQAIGVEAAGACVDLAPHADLLLVGESPHDDHDDHDAHDDHDHDHPDDAHDEDDEQHAHDEDDEQHAHDEDDGHDHGPEDPHFWLDPERYGQVAEVIAAELIVVDPDNAAGYEANLELVLAELDELDQEFAEGLAECRSRDLVTTHEAFGYLAHRYDLRQTGITGITPDSEPSPARLAEVAAQVKDLDVQAIYAEPILRDDIARTIANETDTEVLTLDPVEGITDSSSGSTYAEIMRANLESLRQGLGCS